MDRRNWYFGEYVSEADLDTEFERAETADGRIILDLALDGINSGMAVTQHGAGDDTVDVSAGVAHEDVDGLRLSLAGATNVDCSVDEYGVQTDPGAGNHRYVSLFARFTRRLEDAATDDNGLSVYTQQYEDIELFVRQGAADLLANPITKPALISGAVLLADIEIDNTMTILTADIGYARRQDNLRSAATTLPDYAYGNPGELAKQLYAIVDLHVSDVAYQHAGGAITFATGTAWHDATALASTDVAAAIDEIVDDLADDNAGASGEWGADKVGSDAYATLNGNSDLTRGSVSDQLRETADYLDQAIEDMANLTANELVSGSWTAKTLNGGSLPPNMDIDAEHPGLQFGDGWSSGYNSWNLPWNAAATRMAYGGQTFSDLCAGWYAALNEPVVWAVSTGSQHLYYGRVTVWSTSAMQRLAITMDALDVPVAVCTDGRYVYVLADDGGAGANTNVYKYDTQQSPWTGAYVWKTAIAGAACQSGGGAADYIYCRICNVDATYIALVTPGPAFNGTPIRVLDKAAGGVTSGVGNEAGGLATQTCTGGLCSDGTRIFCTTWDTAGSVAGIVAADPVTVGVPATGPATTELTGALKIFDACCSGPHTHFVDAGGNVYTYSQEIYNGVGAPNQSEAFLLQWATTGAAATNYAFVTTDGVQVWTRTQADTGVLGTGQTNRDFLVAHAADGDWRTNDDSIENVAHSTREDGALIGGPTTIRSFIATERGEVSKVVSSVGTGCAAGQTVDVDVRINGVTCLSAAIQHNSGSGTTTQTGTLAAARYVASGDVVTIVYTKANGGGPTAADLLVTVQVSDTNDVRHYLRRGHTANATNGARVLGRICYCAGSVCAILSNQGANIQRFGALAHRD